MPPFARGRAHRTDVRRGFALHLTRRNRLTLNGHFDRLAGEAAASRTDTTRHERINDEQSEGEYRILRAVKLHAPRRQFDGRTAQELHPRHPIPDLDSLEPRAI